MNPMSKNIIPENVSLAAKRGFVRTATQSLASAGNQSCALRLDNVSGDIIVIGLTAAQTSIWAAFDYPLATP